MIHLKRLTMKIFKNSYRIIEKENRLVVEYRPWYKFEWVTIGSERIDKHVIIDTPDGKAFQVVKTHEAFNRAFNISLEMIEAHKESQRTKRMKPCIIHKE